MASFGYASESPRRIGELPAETQIALLYHSPGNIRELQNVMERSVIVSEGEALSVDESWLSGKPRAPESNSQTELSHRLAAQEKEMIEAALRECGGRVSGPAGAAARRDSRIYSRIEDQGAEDRPKALPVGPTCETS
jgi:DNA-binding NtrC family response regulator